MTVIGVVIDWCIVPRQAFVRRRAAGVCLRLAAVMGLAALLSGCADLGYYWQSVSGHLQVMRVARPISQWLEQDGLSPQLRQRLLLAQALRSFSINELHLPDNTSYRRFADLHRPYAVWNVVAAPPLSLTLKTWCFAVTGCIGYRGYFEEAEAMRLADSLRGDALEVSVYGVPAYSTLGWLNWAGGDPLLNTWINYPDGELARLMFHELAHQVLYVRDDTMFNESFATAVERLGARQWLAAQATAQARQAYALLDQRRTEFRQLTRATREQLAQVYARGDTGDGTDSERLASKRQVMLEFRAAYAALKTRWGGYAGYDAWVAQANNAAFGAQAAYDEWVPAFETMFDHAGHDWLVFYGAVRELAQRPSLERNRQLKAWAQEKSIG